MGTMVWPQRSFYLLKAKGLPPPVSLLPAPRPLPFPSLPGTEKAALWDQAGSGAAFGRWASFLPAFSHHRAEIYMCIFVTQSVFYPAVHLLLENKHFDGETQWQEMDPCWFLSSLSFIL